MITIVDYGMGNLGSIHNMLKRIGVQSQVTCDLNEIEKSKKIILPGVGAFETGMNKLHELKLIEVLNHKALVEKVPVLGICLGMQIICNSSEEGAGSGLSWVDAEVVRFNFANNDYVHKVPHIGWNYIASKKGSVLLAGMNEETRFYFVHSYYVKCKNRKEVLATSTYGIEFDAMFAKENIFGAQFHPEKSHKFGMQLFKNFASI